MTGKRLDLVLVNPGGRKRIYQSLATRLAAIEPPVWAGLMAEFVRRKGLSVAILDTDAFDLEPHEAAQRIEEMNPTLVAVVAYGHQPSASTQVMPSAGAICAAIKQSDPTRKVILVGGHVAALPERTLKEESVDWVADGEGLYTLVELVECLRAGGDEKKVQGLWYRDGEGATLTSQAPLVTDVDTAMPSMAWDLLSMDRYRAHNWHCFGEASRTPYASIYTTLGCPYRCTFCCIQAPFKSGEKVLGYKESSNSYRFWSVESVLAQLEVLVTRYGVKHIKVADEMFVLNRRHITGICNGIIERGYDLNFWAYARVDTVKDDMVDLLKKAGFNWLAFGIEAADAKVRKGVLKGYDQEDIRSCLERVRAGGIYVIGNYIFGLPDDDLASMQATLDLAMDLNCEFGNFYCTMAYPGSQLYDFAQREGWRLPDSWAGYSQHAVDTLPLPTRHLTAGEVISFRDKAFHKYYENPAYLEMIERKFGKDTAEGVREMTSVRIERRFAT